MSRHLAGPELSVSERVRSGTRDSQHDRLGGEPVHAGQIRTPTRFATVTSSV